jgi:membrane protein
LFAATGLFGQLQDALDTIWKVKPKPGRGLWGVVRDRFWSFVIVLIIGALVLALLLVHSALALVERFLEPAGIPASLYFWRLVNLVSSLVILSLAFALIYQVLPDADIAWRDVWLGSGLTAVLFLLGNYLISLYLGWSNVTTAYGAAGSLVVLLLWVYYSAQIFLFGAEFTQVYARRQGKAIEPAANALAVTGAERARQGLAEAPPTGVPLQVQDRVA